jgi:hypothetical protein
MRRRAGLGPLMGRLLSDCLLRSRHSARLLANQPGTPVGPSNPSMTGLLSTSLIGDRSSQ